MYCLSFDLENPVMRAQNPPMSDHNLSRDATGPIRIFVLNDSAVFVEAVQRFLSDEPDMHVVGVAAGLPEALTDAVQAQADVILIDPEPRDRLIGQAIRDLRAALPQVGIVVLTLHEEEADRSTAMEAGADAFVGKWAAADELVQTIRFIVGRDSRPAAEGEPEKTG